MLCICDVITQMLCINYLIPKMYKISRNVLHLSLEYTASTEYKSSSNLFFLPLPL